MHAIVNLYAGLTTRLDQAGSCLGLLAIRLLLAWEFWEAGVQKYTGENWFINIQGSFPFPFSVVPVDISWSLATWTELLGAVALLIGLGTRFFSVSLIILTIVAWVSVHSVPMPNFSLLLSNPSIYLHYASAAFIKGYNVCDNGFKLPLMYLVMFIPLLLSGPGKLSLDHWLARRFMTH